jgi:GR25 family glycosyltransferase involved in LPS biosynthesis
MKKIQEVAFGEIYVINRDEDVERLVKITKRLNEMGISFERFRAICYTAKENHEWVGMRGVNASHLAIVIEAEHRSLENVLIIEDDAIFRPNFRELWQKIQPKLNSIDYDIFYGFNWRNRNPGFKYIDITEIRRTPCAHFWAIHSRFYRRFIDTIEANERLPVAKAVDQIFTSDIAKIYAPTYNLVGQDEGTSTTMGGALRGIRWHAMRSNEYIMRAPGA